MLQPPCHRAQSWSYEAGGENGALRGLISHEELFVYYLTLSWIVGMRRRGRRRSDAMIPSSV